MQREERRKQFGLWLAEQIEQKKLSVTELAESMDITRETIYRLIKGKQAVTDEVVTRLSIALDMPEQTILLASAGFIAPRSQGTITREGVSTNVPVLNIATKEDIEELKRLIETNKNQQK